MAKSRDDELHWVYEVEPHETSEFDFCIIPQKGRSYSEALDLLTRTAERLLDRMEDDPEFTIKCRLRKASYLELSEIEDFDLTALGPDTLASADSAATE